jgi:hypothetical protein
MANQKFKIVLEKNIGNFKDEYVRISRQQFTQQSGKLLHAGEFGLEREKICRELFKKFTSSHIDISSGFVINSQDETSTQQDLIFFDRNNTPILNFEEGRFFPVETIACVGQIKSILNSKKELKDALFELVELKKMREKIPHPGISRTQKQTFDGIRSYEPESYAYDQISTFLVCEKFDFDISAEEIDEFYPSDLPVRFKHNFILNLEDGLYQYTHKANAFPYPYARPGEVIVPRFTKNYDDVGHILIALSNIFLITQGTTILHMELGDYYL